MITGVKEWPAYLRFFSFQCLEMRYGTALLISGNFGTALLLTLSLLGYLKTRIWWGGVNLTPPSKSHV